MASNGQSGGRGEAFARRHGMGTPAAPGRWRLGPALVSLLLAAILPAGAAELEQVNLRYGQTFTPSDVDGWSVGLDFKAESPPGILHWFGDDIHYQISTGQWLDTGVDGDDEIYFVEGGPFWRYTPDFLGDRWYIDWGVGFAWLSDDDLDEDREVGGPPVIATEVTLARSFGSDRRWQFGIRLRHDSNGGFLGEDGEGVNILTFELGYRFGPR